MNTELHNSEEIENYLQGTNPNIAQFEQKILENESLRQEVEIHRMFASTLQNKEKNQFRSLITEISKDFSEEQELTISHKTAIVRNINEYKKYFLSIAAALLVVICGIWFFNNKEENQALTDINAPIKPDEKQVTPVIIAPKGENTMPVEKRNENYVETPKTKQTLPKLPNEPTAETDKLKTNAVSASFELENIAFDKTIKKEADGRVKLNVYAEIKQDEANTNNDFQFEFVEKNTQNEVAFSKSVQSVEEKPLGFAKNKPTIKSIELTTKATLKVGFYTINVKDKEGKLVNLGEIEIKE
jgi:hypothetical protein